VALSSDAYSSVCSERASLNQKVKTPFPILTTSSTITGCDPAETDTHWRAKKGKASFNWRLLFDVELGHSTRAMKFPYLHLQLWDRDILKWNDCAGEGTVNLGRYYRKAYKRNMALKLFETKKGAAAKRAGGDNTDSSTINPLTNASCSSNTKAKKQLHSPQMLQHTLFDTYTDDIPIEEDSPEVHAAWEKAQLSRSLASQPSLNSNNLNDNTNTNGVNITPRNSTPLWATASGKFTTNNNFSKSTKSPTSGFAPISQLLPPRAATDSDDENSSDEGSEEEVGGGKIDDGLKRVHVDSRKKVKMLPFCRNLVCLASLLEYLAY